MGIPADSGPAWRKWRIPAKAKGDPGSGHPSAFSRRDAPELCRKVRRPGIQRAQGRPGARCTRGLACNWVLKRRTRAYRFSGNTPAFPAQWFDGLSRAHPGVMRCLVSVAWRKPAPWPGRARNASARLDASHGRRVHTILPYAAMPSVCPPVWSLTEFTRPATTRAPDTAASTAPRPTFRDDHDTPL